MVVERATGRLLHHHFRDLPQFLHPGDLLIYNESRVIPARLFARKASGGRVEILLLHPRTPEVWAALVRGRGVRSGTRLEVLSGPQGVPVGATVQVAEEGERGWRLLAFDRPALPLATSVGQIPLPPYIHIPLQDPERYQTVYARTPGSAAAPTAGLHFTPDLLARLDEMGVERASVTLHIGLDTFRPVQEEWVEDHTIHTEYCTLPPVTAQAVSRARKEGRRVIAVGTTAVRVLETAGKGSEPEAEVLPFEGPTDLFIYPGFAFRVVEAMITNFHLPRSTLLMLVAAFCGKELLDRAYAEAIRLEYRFYSFGDAMLII